MIAWFLRLLGFRPQPTTVQQMRALFSAESRVKPRYTGDPSRHRIGRAS